MEDRVKHALLAFLVMNALFWGLFPHSSHCEVLSYLSSFTQTNIECPEHRIHLLMGVLFYVLSVWVAQKDVY